MTQVIIFLTRTPTRAIHGPYRLKQSQISYNAIHKCIAIGDACDENS